MEANPSRSDRHAEVLVLGAGPGGYTAAFRAADLGKQVTVIERYPTLGGVCLNVGCIPSKALLHVAGVIAAAESLGAHGVEFGALRIDSAKLDAWKDSVVQRLAMGLSQLARNRNVEVLQGVARFESDRCVVVENRDGTYRVSFDVAIIAAGSRPIRLAEIPEDPRIVDSTGALRLTHIPERFLVIGGGVIGLEMASVYDALGSTVTVVEKSGRLIPGADADLVRVLRRRLDARYHGIHLHTGVTGIDVREHGLKVHFEGQAPAQTEFDRILVAIGRRPNADSINAEAAGVYVDAKGFIQVDSQQRTNLRHIFAIGDIVGAPLLAHKASHQGKVAAEVIAGKSAAFDPRGIPAVAYTDPEIAWVGLTEDEAVERNVDVEIVRFPWAASGRALGMARPDGLTKLIFDKARHRLLGAGIVGLHAGDLISEVLLALEMGADAADVRLSVHPHPTLSETIAFAAEIAEGTVTELYMPNRLK